MPRVFLAVVTVLGVAACSDNVETTSMSASATLDSAATATSSTEPASGSSNDSGAPVLNALQGDVLGTTQLDLLGDGALMDADSGTRETVDGLPPLGDVYWAERIEAAVIVTIDCVECTERPQTFMIREGEHEAEHVVSGVFVTPAIEGLWAKRFLADNTCELSRITVTGDVVQQARPIDCRLGLVEETALGLVAFLERDSLLINTTDFSEIRRWRAPARLAAVIGRKLLIDDTHSSRS